MLHVSLIEQLAEKLKIASINILREHIEMEVLDNLSRTKLSERLIFYGGTALRLAYKAPRFSEDLDFLLTRPLKQDKKILNSVLEAVVKDNNGVKIEEIIEKRHTLFGLLHISGYLKHPFRLKIEIAKKKNGLKSKASVLTSPASVIQPIFKTATLESLWQTKLTALKNRNKPRDWFDIWYLAERMQKDAKLEKKFPFSKMEFQNELKRWLPRDKWKIINTVITYYDQSELSKI